MEYSDIKRLLDDMGNSKVDSLDIEFPDGTKIKMKKNEAKIIEAIEPRPVPAVKEVTLPAEAKEEPKAVVATENYKEVKSPMVGTFYSAPCTRYNLLCAYPVCRHYRHQIAGCMSGHAPSPVRHTVTFQYRLAAYSCRIKKYLRAL